MMTLIFQAMVELKSAKEDHVYIKAGSGIWHCQNFVTVPGYNMGLYGQETVQETIQILSTLS